MLNAWEHRREFGAACQNHFNEVSVIHPVSRIVINYVTARLSQSCLNKSVGLRLSNFL
jgi:hypothetical protein